MKIIAGSPADLAPARALALGRARAVLEALAVLGASLAVFAFVQLGTSGLADNDAYYHTKMAWLMREQGLTPRFIWLPQSILSPDAFYDHHMLFHVYLALFVGDGSEQRMVAGAKLASVLMPALMCLALWWLLRAERVPWPALWAIGLLGLSQAFLFRMSMVRAQSASLLLLLLALHCLLRRRHWLLVPLGFVYVWLYNAFPLLLVLAGAYLAAALLAERRLEWRALAYPALGIALGLVINPYFPANLSFIAEHLAPKLGASDTAVGNEWYPYDTWVLLGNSGFALAAWLLGALALGWRERRIDRPTLTAFALSVAFGFLLFKSRRFVEYFPPFALIFAALSCGPLLGEWAGARPLRLRLAQLALLAAVAAPIAVMAPQARAAMASMPPSATYAAASGWLSEHAPAGAKVFQTDWDDFPLLFFHNSASIYTIGLDPTFMERYDPALFAEWVAITRGRVERPSAPIRARFGASYAISDLRHGDFLRQAAADPGMREVFRDEYAVVFEVFDQ